MIDGIIRMMDAPNNFTGPINIGNPNEFSILELAEKVIELTESKSKIVYRPLPQDDPMKRQPCIDLAKQHLEWEPKTDLQEGLRRTIEYFKNII
jgi:UDP-glucuronate decarboxylase